MTKFYKTPPKSGAIGPFNIFWFNLILKIDTHSDGNRIADWDRIYKAEFI